MHVAAQRCIRLGVTGGIGSGKSTVSQVLAARGAALIDADALSRGVTASGGAAIGPIRDAFGAEFIDAQGALDRTRMRALVFTDAHARARLERIVHPLVAEATERAARHARQAGSRLLVFDIPLLAESRAWPARLDAVLVVDCSEDTQLERVRQRSGLAPDAVRAIMATQSSRAKRLAVADLVLWNDGITRSELLTKVHEIATRFGL